MKRRPSSSALNDPDFIYLEVEKQEEGEDVEEEKQESSFSALWSYLPSTPRPPSLSSIRESYEDFRSAVAPFFTKDNGSIISSTILSNLVLPVVSAILVHSSVQNSSEEENENSAFNSDLILAALIPAASIVIRDTVNAHLTKSLTASIRHNFIEELEQENVLTLKDHSPHTTKDLPSTPEIVLFDSGKFARSAVPLTAAMLGNIVDLLSVAYSSYEMVGAKTALSVGAIGVVTALLNAGIGNMNSQILKENDLHEEGLSTMLRYAEKNKQQVVALGSKKELERVDELMDIQESTRLKRSLVDGTYYMSNLLVHLVAPQILRSLDSIYEEGTTSDEINAFSLYMTQFTRGIINVLQPLTQGRVNYDVSVKRLSQLHKIIDDVKEFKENSPLKVNYLPEGEFIEFSNFSLAKPSEEVFGSLIDKVNVSLNDENLASLRNTNLKLETGKTYQLVGESGWGKSTLLKALTGSWPYASGNISFPCKKEEIYFIPQETITGYKSTLLGVMIYPRDESEISDLQKKKVIELMRELGLSERIPNLENPEEKDWSTLSRGEQQRIALIRMLMTEPETKVLLMDEATASVDGNKSQIMHDLIKEYLPQATVIYISHDTSKGEKVAEDEIQVPSGRTSPRFADATITINKDTGQLVLSDVVNSRLLDRDKGDYWVTKIEQESNNFEKGASTTKS